MTAASVQNFVADSFETELSMFRAALDGVPGAEFQNPRLGHSAAWHALHIAEWLRFFVLQDFTASYAHLGWEDAGWMAEFRGTPTVAETEGKVMIMAELARVEALIVPHIRGLQDEQLGELLRAPAAPAGQRERLTGLGMQLRHVAYHRGQLKLAQKGAA